MTTRPRWAGDVAVPDWLELREGRRAVVVVAPHGGRRLRAIRRGDRVNDLHTAGIALDLAARLDAHAIVNFSLDRNDIDLNRISHLVERAPEALALLANAVEHAGRGGEVPLVLFVHGWNMVVPCCDVGIGLKRRGDALAGRHPTLGRARYEGTVARIEAELRARGVATAIGRRYTASGRDNAAQLFSGRHADHDDAVVAALGRLAADGRVDAAQLELGIPLRWEGPARTALVDGLAAALQGDVSPQPRPRDEWGLPSMAVREGGETSLPGFALQAVLDGDGRVALFGGVEATGPHALASRLCVLATDGTMMLLVGEGEWDGDARDFAMDGLHWRVHEDGARIDLRLRGPMIRYRTHEAYLDLEEGLSASDLVDGEANLRFDADADGHGRLTGTLRCGGLAMDVDATAFVDRGRRGGGDAADRIRVLAPRPGAAPVVLRSDAGAALEHCRDAGGLGVIRGAAGAAGTLHEAEILARVPVWRPVADGVFARWTFGVARCRFHGDEGAVAGLFDTLEVFRIGAAPQPRRAT